MYFKRNIFDSVSKQLDRKEYIIITGARQTGKTTLLTLIQEYLVNNQKTTYFLNLEENDVLHELNLHPENVFKFFNKDTKEKIFLLIDEIQYLDDPTNFLKLLFDKYNENLKIIATGSSAFYIDTKFKDSLAGRKFLFELSTLSFDEFLNFKTGNDELSEELILIRKNEDYISLKRKEIEILFDEYLTYGGYPRVALAENEEEKIDLLKESISSYIKRDIYEANIQHQQKFLDLMKIMASQTGSLLNVNELANTLGLSLTAVNNYIFILRKCFHINLLRPFYKNIRKELTHMPKIYFNDLGLRNILLNQFPKINDRMDKGELIENYMFLRLKELFNTDDIYFWRTTDGNEVDFVIKNNFYEGFAIEIKFNPATFNKSKYEKFIKNYPEFPLSCRSYLSNLNKESILGL